MRNPGISGKLKKVGGVGAGRGGNDNWERVPSWK